MTVASPLHNPSIVLADRERQRFEHLVLGRPRPKPGRNKARKGKVAPIVRLAPGIEEIVQQREEWAGLQGTPQTRAYVAAEQRREGSLARLVATGVIEQLDYAALIRRYDSADTLFYLDPPYDETTGYGLPFGRDQYVAMAEQLAGIAGQFVLSINATPFIRETFARFDIADVETTWTLSGHAAGTGQRVTELIIRSPAR